MKKVHSMATKNLIRMSGSLVVQFRGKNVGHDALNARKGCSFVDWDMLYAVWVLGTMTDE